MKYLLERHPYAPELNTLYRRTAAGWVAIAKAGSSMGKSAFSSIRDYRNAHAPAKSGIFAIVKTHYQDEGKKWLERTHSGLVKHRKDALEFARHIKKCLADGGSVTVKTRVVF